VTRDPKTNPPGKCLHTRVAALQLPDYVARVRVILVLLVLTLAGCTAKGAVLLSVDAQGPNGRLAIPADIDTLTVAASLPDGTVLLEELAFTLKESTFPVTLGVDPGPRTGSRVRFTVTAKRQEALVAAGVTEVVIDARRLTSTTLLLQTD
jgi:hypothetical protein